tara:strand:- start:1681 stop:2088 length:408 start_codon:yes stop_codon:yes gene_type:complete
MINKYLKKIIAQSPSDLQVISACCSESKVKISNIKYLAKSKIFLLLIERKSIEKDNYERKIRSIIKFDFIDDSKSKNINQSNPDYILELLAIDLLKKENNYEIILLFSNNAFITLRAEIIEVTLEDQKEIDDQNI